MTTATNKSHVKGVSEVEETYVKRRGWFLIFPTTWYEKVNTEYLGNDIIIETEHKIRNVYLNGELLEPTGKKEKKQ